MHGAVPPELQQLVRAQVVLRPEGAGSSLPTLAVPLRPVLTACPHWQRPHPRRATTPPARTSWSRARRRRAFGTNSGGRQDT
eukprot:scaffold9336_cov77-Phaeocystis_antarctica.AAC.2